MLLLMLFFAISLAMLMRSVLIMTGMYKSPILRTFEKYGDDETIYFPLPALMLWTGLTLIAAALLLTNRAWAPLAWPGLLLLLGAYIIYQRDDIAVRYPHIFLTLPRWYADLRERTTRFERRRLAYMWLWLPRRLRLIYNASDPAFNQWADLVIMASMTYDEDSDAWRDLTSSTY